MSSKKILVVILFVCSISSTLISCDRGSLTREPYSLERDSRCERNSCDNAPEKNSC